MAKKIIPFVLIALLLILVVWQMLKRPSTPLVTVHSGTIMIMGTFTKIQIEADTPEQGRQALKNATETLRRFEQQISTYRPDSEMSEINRQAAEKAIPISDLAFDILKKSIEYSKLTNGAFDITVTPYLKIWKQAAKENRLPDPAELDQAKQFVGWEKIKLSENPKTVRFTTRGVTLTVDAIAKGLAVDYALDAMKIPGVRSALVDIGGEISCFGRPWTIGVQDPFAQDNDNQLSQTPRRRLRCQNLSIATSGNYRRYVTIAGQHFSHIIDPRTGMPAEKLPSVTVIAKKTVDADALATAISVMGPEEGLKLAQSLPGVEALLIAGTPEKTEILKTSAFGQYEIPPEE